MRESQRVFDRRARDEAEVFEMEELDEDADVFLDLLFEMLKRPDVRAAICNIVAASKPTPKPPRPKPARTPMRGARRG